MAEAQELNSELQGYQDELDRAEELKQAVDFIGSIRGRYILSQALHHAIKVMSAVEPEVRQEKSNIADMEYLRETLFNFPSVLFEPMEIPADAYGEI